MKKSTSPKAYQTTWKQGKNKGTYRTKSLTQFHKDIHSDPKTDYASTIETDSSVDWPFGLYAEVIAVTNKKNPAKNKAFAN
jgi:hypothetical protein